MSHAGCVQIVDFVQVCEQVRRRFQGSEVLGRLVGWHLCELPGGSVALSCYFVSLVCGAGGWLKYGLLGEGKGPQVGGRPSPTVPSAVCRKQAAGFRGKTEREVRLMSQREQRG